MRKQASAHRRQAAAHSWQWSIECLSHSSAHIWQTDAQTRQKSFALSLSRDMAAEARWQIAAQSMSSAMQRAIIFTSSSSKQAEAQ